MHFNLSANQEAVSQLGVMSNTNVSENRGFGHLFAFARGNCGLREAWGWWEVEGPKRYKLRLSQSELLKYNMDGLKSEINHHVPRTDSHRTVSTAGLQSKGNTLTMLRFYHMTAHDLCAIPLVGYVTRGQTNHSVTKKKKKK